MSATYGYYSKHSRKTSGSQTSLPEQLQNAINESASQSLSFLPATIYSGPQPERSEHTNPVNSPDAFYQQYQHQFSQSAIAPLRQGAIRAIDVNSTNLPDTARSTPLTNVENRHGVLRNGLLTNEHEVTRSHLSSPGLRGRKSSVKNLVNQINATASEEQPPMPATMTSRGGSRNVSPVISSQLHRQSPDTSRNVFLAAATTPLTRYESAGDVKHGSNSPSRSVIGSGYGTAEISLHSRRPLFGEVVTGTSSQSTAGYGIQNFRRRSGSVGSPLQSPHLQLTHDTKLAPRNINENAATDNNFTLSPAVYTAPDRQINHRRTNSENPLTPTRNVSAGIFHSIHPYSQHKTSNSQSRIPISVRRGSNSSDPDGQLSNSYSSPQDVSTPVRDKPKQRSPRRRQRSPPAIQSPGQRGKAMNISQGPKSPSLRANIIVPPPKISPPLRSSRPRLPISSASTAASRAKMAEKFSNMQRLNDEKRQATRKAARPPELSDIDLKARRLRITQALSRSLEGQDLKGNKRPPRRRDFSTSRTASLSFSSRSDQSEDANDLPSVIVDDSLTAVNLPLDFTSIEGAKDKERASSHHPLETLRGTSRSQDLIQDSPTLGSSSLPPSSRPALLETNLARLDRSNEPSSAVTEGTIFDHEPQEDNTQDATDQSIADRLNFLRHQNSVHDSEYSMFSDRGDKESVQIVLRDTIHLDDEEAIRKGYRIAPSFPTPPIPHTQHSDHSQRHSWASSINGADHNVNRGYASQSDHNITISPEEGIFPPSGFHYLKHSNIDQSVRSTMASDTYTIVNIVLQQHSTSGIVDQQFVDDVYQRILEDSPFDDESSLSADRIEQICLQEIQDREASWYKPSETTDTANDEQPIMEEDITETPTRKSNRIEEDQHTSNDWLSPNLESFGLKPPPFLKGHNYKSSLDSAEDWADTSPSVSDWIRFAADEEPAESAISAPTTKSIISDTDKNESIETNAQAPKTPTATANGQEDQEDPDLYSAPTPRPTTTGPPPPVAADDSVSSGGTHFGSAVVSRPQIPRRVTSVSQISRASSIHGRQSPNVSAPVLGKVSSEEAITPEQRRLKQRKNVIKELVDTEFTYEKDLRVLCDIYKQTASAALGEDDIRILFGNVEQVQAFSKDFLMLLKSLAKPTYAMERQERKKDMLSNKGEGSVRPRSSSSLAASGKAIESDAPTPEKDRETRIGQAFEASLADMERVYSDYIKNRHAANLRLQVVQKLTSAQEWLKECKENSSDITNAWNLDALLVKPVQRVTKYPLLLKELVDSTPEDHPDLSFLRRALYEVTEVNIRINDVKKHAELVDQVLNRKRKDSDVRAGLSKAFGRRAEKLKQHVGMTELYEDAKYNEIKIHYDNNIVQLMVVGNDCSSYGRAITKWVNKMVEIAAAAEAWVDVGHSNHQEAESKLRQFAMVVRGISTIALPDHLEQLNSKVLGPMQQAVDAMTKFKSDQRGLLQKREKRMIDYAQIKSRKDRGEKIDKKMTERMEQSEALNVEAKQRMRKLIAATAKLVQSCQVNLVQMQISWHNMIRQKLSAAMGISLEHLDVEDVEKEWQLDFDFQEASALSLGICNGSLLAEAVNLVSFQTSTTTLNGEESPRQASFTSASKRSMSLASESSYPPIPEYDPRTSGTFMHQYHEHPAPFANSRNRAQSGASARLARTPELSQHGSAMEGFTSFSQHSSGVAPPRLSVETPSPLIGLLQPEPPTHRPGSSSTFFSASGTPPPQSQQQAQHQSTGSGIFNSAMPMSDSPVAERAGDSAIASDPDVLFTAASVYEFNIDRSRREAGFPYLTYVTGEIFDIIGERGELWLAKNQDDPQSQIGWIWNKHFAKLAE